MPSNFGISASSFTGPASISGLRLWCDAGTLSGEGSAIATWNDLSSGRYDLTAVGTGPVWNANQVNGKPALTFNGSSNRFTIPDAVFTGQTGGEVFIVIKAAIDPAATTASSGIWHMSSDALTNDATYPYTTPGALYDAWGSTQRQMTGDINPTPTLAAWRVYNISSKPHDWIVRLDGTPLKRISTNAVGWSTAGNSMLGRSGSGNYWLSGKVAEILIYDHPLSRASRARIHTYLADKYALTVSTPQAYVSSFNPLSVSPSLWLDASDVGSITSTGSPALVSQWSDKSGNNRHFTQATAANKPGTGMATLGGMNVVSFDETDFLMGPIHNSAVDNFAVTIVLFPTGRLGSTQVQQFPLGNGAWATSGWSVSTAGYATSFIGWMRNGAAAELSTQVPLYEPQVITFARVAGTVGLWVDDIKTSNVSTSAPSTPTISSWLGNPAAGASFTGHVGEVISWSSATVQQALDMHAYAMGKWFDRPAPVTPSGWTPRDYGPILWFDASDLASITSAGGAVSAWANKAAPGATPANIPQVVQATAAAKPGTGAVTQNGLNVLTFDGGDCLTGAATNMNMGEYTAFVVADRTNPGVAGGGGLLTIHGSTGQDQSDLRSMTFVCNDTASSGGGQVPQVTLNQAVSGVTGQAQNLGYGVAPMSVWKAGHTGEIAWVWRGEAGYEALPRPGTYLAADGGVIIGGRFIGGVVSATNRHTGKICEVLVYPTFLTPTQRNLVDAYLTAKWGIKNG